MDKNSSHGLLKTRTVTLVSRTYQHTSLRRIIRFICVLLLLLNFNIVYLLHCISKFVVIFPDLEALRLASSHMNFGKRLILGGMIRFFWTLQIFSVTFGINYLLHRASYTLCNFVCTFKLFLSATNCEVWK